MAASRFSKPLSQSDIPTLLSTVSPQTLPPTPRPDKSRELSLNEISDLYWSFPAGLTPDEVQARLESAGVDHILALMLSEYFRREPEEKAQRKHVDTVLPESDPRNKWLRPYFRSDDYRPLVVDAIDNGKLDLRFKKTEFLALVYGDASWWNHVTIQCRMDAESKKPTTKPEKQPFADVLGVSRFGEIEVKVVGNGIQYRKLDTDDKFIFRTWGSLGMKGNTDAFRLLARIAEHGGSLPLGREYRQKRWDAVFDLNRIFCDAFGLSDRPFRNRRSLGTQSNIGLIWYGGRKRL